MRYGLKDQISKNGRRRETETERGQIRRRKEPLENALGLGFCGGVGLSKLISHGALRCTFSLYIDYIRDLLFDRD